MTKPASSTGDALFADDFLCCSNGEHGSLLSAAHNADGPADETPSHTGDKADDAGGPKPVLSVVHARRNGPLIAEVARLWIKPDDRRRRLPTRRGAAGN